MTDANVYTNPWRPPVPDFLKQIRPGNFALVAVDMQYYDAHPDAGIVKQLKERGRGDSTAYFERRLETVTPNIRRLAQATRKAGGIVVWTRIQASRDDGADRSLYYKYLNVLIPPHSRDGEILAELEPAPDDLFISKGGGGAFYGTNLEYALRNVGVTHLLICGVVTEGCIESTTREAADRSFANVLIEDACTTWEAEMHAAALRAIGTRYASIRSTADALAQLERLVSEAPRDNVHETVTRPVTGGAGETSAIPLRQLASVIRSKQSGPFRLTFDILFDNEELYRAVKASGAINADVISALYKIPREHVTALLAYDPAWAFKISIKRRLAAGDPGDSDLYGAQQHAPLLDLMISLPHPVGGRHKP
ncbi:MAG TPA: isochorismatase family protein [bacterium]|nr:isochorismatase family protein [bacterium]